MTDNPLAKYMPQTATSRKVESINPLEKYKTEKVSTTPVKEENPLAKYYSPQAPSKESVNPLEKYTSPEKEGLPPTIPSAATTQGRFASGVSNVAKSFLTHFAGVPENMAVMAKELADVTHWPGEAGKPITDYSLYKAGLAIEKTAKSLFPTNPKYQKEFITTTLTGGVGSALGFMTSLLLGKGIGMSEGAVGALVGASGAATEEYKRAIEKGATEDEAIKTWAANLPIGATAAIPFTRALGRINGVTKGWLGKVIGSWAEKVPSAIGGVAEGGVENAVQMAFMNFASNATAKELYDAERSLWEGVPEGGASGLIIGMGLNALGAGVRRRIEKIGETEPSLRSKEDKEILRNWAKTQVDESEWINYLEKGGEPPVDLDQSYAQGFREGAVDNPLPPGMSEKDVDAVYRKPTRIQTALRAILFPEYIFKRQADKGLKTEAPMRLSVDVIEGQLAIVQHERDLESHYKTISSGMKKVDKVDVREAMDLAYGLRDPNIDVVIKASYRNALAKMYEKNPKLKNVIEGVDKRGGLIELFEHEKKRFQESKRLEYKTELDPELYDMFSEVIDQGKTVEQTVLDNIDIEGMAKQEFLDRQVAKRGGLGLEKAERDWNAREKVRDRKIKSVKKRELGKLERKVDDYRSIATWGLKDFQTRIELGNYRILDQNDKTVAWAQNVEDARKKAAEIRNRIFKETGKKPPRYIIEPEVSRINPTAKRKGVLSGEVDIFDSLPRYIHAMEKRIVMNPIIAKFKALKKSNPEDFTPDVNGIIQQQINAVMGSNYEWMERVVDEWSVAKGWRTGKYRRAVGFARRRQAEVKLGYRPVSAFINGATGYGMTYVKVGAEFWAKGAKILREGEYKGADGKIIDIKSLVKKLEEEGQLGVDFAVQDDGTISSRLPIWHPLKIFQAPEGPVRRHGFAANYILQRELYGKSHEEAVWLAKQGVRFQQSTYNTAAIPELFRSPSGKLIFQFKSFMISQMQLWSTLSKPELARMIQVQMLLAGPRGLVYFLKSIPILGAMGLLDKVEELVTKKDTTIGKLSKGVTGLVGIDVSAPATFQFPNKATDWLGPTISNAVDLFQDVVIPGAQALGAEITGHPENAPNYVGKNAVNWAKGLAPITYYWDQLLQSVLYWETWKDVKDGNLKQAWETSVKNWQTPNIWIRDSNGNKAYQIGGVWDRLMLLSGAKLSQQSEEQALKQIWNRNMKIRGENRKNKVGDVLRKLQRGQVVTKEDSQDLVLYGIDPRSIPDRYEIAEMTPTQRAVLKARLLDKAEAIDHFNFDKARRIEP